MHVHRTVRIAVVLLGVSMLVCTSGCIDILPASVKSRVSATIEDAEAGWRASQPPWQVARNRNVAAALRAATVESLREPRLCNACLGYTDKGALLIVDWIEDWPTPDGVRIATGPDSKSVDVKIWTAETDQNREDAKRIVRYVASFHFPLGSDGERLLGATGDGSVVLTKDGQPVSNKAPIHRVNENGSLKGEEGP